MMQRCDDMLGIPKIQQSSNFVCAGAEMIFTLGAISSMFAPLKDVMEFGEQNDAQ
jgi:hypothetical protein